MNGQKSEKRIYFFLILAITAWIVPVCMLPAQDSGRQRGLDFLEQAAVLLSEDKSREALDTALAGTAFDPSIADLYYIQAAALFNLGNPARDILPPAFAALKGDWLHYNGIENRLLLASLLCDTGRGAEALKILDDSPAVSQTADALFIRALSLYRLGRAAEARTVAETALNTYPRDSRFPLMFFTQELLLRNKTGIESSAAKKTADIIIPRLYLWEEEAPLTSLYAVPFVSSAADRVRFLRSFRAAGNSSPLWTVLALREGLIGEDAALTDIQRFSKDGLQFALFTSFVSLIASDAVRAQIDNWLSSFSGTFIWDISGDGIADLTCAYEAGRPALFRFDMNQDGGSEYTAFCDYGAPVELRLDNGLTVYYDVWPFVSRAVSGSSVYTLVPGSLAWQPIELKPVRVYPLHNDIYIPVPRKIPDALSSLLLVSYSSQIEVPSDERPGARIIFSLSEGLPVSSITAGDSGAPYASAVFERGLPVSRSLDADGDGMYEITEKYAYIPGLAAAESALSEKDGSVSEGLTVRGKNGASALIFGRDAPVSDIALVQVLADIDKDGYAEYSELIEYPVYTSTEGQRFAQDAAQSAAPSGITKTISWDTDKNGSWNTCYIQYADDREEYLFIHPLSDNVVAVALSGGIPVSVSEADEVKAVTKDSHSPLFWIGNLPQETSLKTLSVTIGADIIAEYNRKGVPGVSLLIDNGNYSVIAVSAGGFYFAEIINE